MHRLCADAFANGLFNSSLALSHYCRTKKAKRITAWFYQPAPLIVTKNVLEIICKGLYGRGKVVFPLSYPSKPLLHPLPSCQTLQGGVSGLRIRSFAHSLILLKSNEWLWAICSGPSEEMSNHERIAQVAQDKWVIVSILLRSLMINERMSDSLKKF